MPINRTNPDGSTSSIPADLRNADYREHLAKTGTTHEQVLAAERAEREAAASAAKTENARLRASRRSGRDKLIALGLTRAEFRALFDDPDHE